MSAKPVEQLSPTNGLEVDDTAGPDPGPVVVDPDQRRSWVAGTPA
jgi:hypothetical protein